MSIPSFEDRPFGCPPDDGPAPVTITLAGPPQGKGRARAFLRAGRIAHYTPGKTATYEGMIRTAAMGEMAGRHPLDEPLELVMRAVFPIPSSWPLRKQQQALMGDIKPAKKPDLDNILKAWKDALNGVVYRDDALIVRASLEKRYGQSPFVVVTIRGLK